MENLMCPCGSGKSYDDCCGQFISGNQPETAEQLMRSRYTAYVRCDVPYLIKTTHPSKRKFFSASEIRDWATRNKWLKLEIVRATEKQVEFKAWFIEGLGSPQMHHEISDFVREKGIWSYLKGTFPA